MLTLPGLAVFLQENNCDCERIAHETPIRSALDAKQYFDLTKAALDNRLLSMDYIYGGSGDELHTLKIAPAEVVRLNRILAFVV
ncbi:hypothetical protein [Paenibacillus riograndensis]|uniref:Uncharacterized protein n=2 Tax=Paenibacillus riograndensis TaxID=483937 RepID=A0A132TIN6_9BACL|nr:hypothetical protein [Paenibacillus riograndensis]KWX71063.1 hypothetical protein AMQ84_29040 [Paenibacillus riograndensis]CQR55501.1 hypothetical protein PRIO_3098 [Paenibacillus riograndensis SBR5]